MIFDKPKNTSLTLANIKADQLEFFCKTSFIDKIVCERKKIPYCEEVAEELDRHMNFYFVVLKNRQYDVISGDVFEPWLKENKISDLPSSAKAKACIEHFIKKFA